MHRFEHPPSSALLIGLAALLAAVFAADLFTPVGVAVWVFYFVPVVLAYLGSLRALPVIMAGAVSLLLPLGYALSPIRDTVIAHLRTFPSIRVWVAGCGTGEELYSLAVLFREEGPFDRTMFYATDISARALRIAEAGVYDIGRAAAFSVNHHASGGRSSLAAHYTAAYGRIAFDRTLRARTVFAEHSLATDAVFAEVQLVTCRNVLIYFQRRLQDRALALFADALPAHGILGLGLRESLRFNAHAPRFRDLVPAVRLYLRQGAR